MDGSLYAERELAGPNEIAARLGAARRAQAEWRHIAAEERADVCTRFVDAFVANSREIAAEISWQMGRPLSQSPGEVRGFEERARHMIGIAPEALADIRIRGAGGSAA